MPALTYNALVEQVQQYMENNSISLTQNIPLFIQNAQQRIGTELKTLETKAVVTQVLPAGANVLQKPTNYKNLVLFQTSLNNILIPLKQVGYGVATLIYPTNTSGVPEFISDFDIQHWLISPAPAVDTSFVLSYYIEATPIDTDNQTNSLTDFAYNLLLYATLLEAIPYEKQDERQIFQALYDKALQQYIEEDRMRITSAYTTRSIN